MAAGAASWSACATTRSPLSRSDKSTARGSVRASSAALDVGKRDTTPSRWTRRAAAARRPLPNDEAALRGVFGELTEHGRVLVVVDQPASIGALPLAVARDAGHRGRLPARAGDAPDRRPHPGRGQDRRQGRVRHRRRRPHHAAHPAPGRRRRRDHSPSWACWSASTTTSPREATRLTNRIRGLLTSTPPWNACWARASTAAASWAARRRRHPGRRCAAGADGITAGDDRRVAADGHRLLDEILAALDEQTVDRPGHHRVGRVIPASPRQLRDRPTTSASPRRRDRGPPGGPPSFQGPDLDARRRGQDRARCCSPSATAAASPPPPTWPPTPASPRSPASPAPRSKGETQPRGGNRRSSAPCSCPRSPVSTTRPAAPTTTANAPKARTTPPPSSASPAAASTSSSPCSATAAPTSTRHPSPAGRRQRPPPRLDRSHRDTSVVNGGGNASRCGLGSGRGWG